MVREKNSRNKGFLANLFFKNGKKGWTKILEVFVAIVLLASILTVVLEGENQEDNEFQRIYEKQHTASKIIQMNQSMRSSILSGQVTKEIKATLNKTLPEMECKAKTCSISKECGLQKNQESEIYAQETRFYANVTHYKPKKLKIFCW
ncbi:MAG: hypothetical protein ABEI74_03945 [Candidatus Pacearchaeota archaeon]